VPLKDTLLELLEGRRYEELAELAARRRRVLGSLVSLTFYAEPLVQWRAVEAMGAAAQRIAEDDPDAVREHLRRLFWLITEESGGICWHAPQAIAEIVARLPQTFPEYVPIVINLICEFAEEDLEHFRPGMLWAIGRLGAVAEGHFTDAEPHVEAALDVDDPQARGMAAWCLGRVGRAAILAGRTDLLDDDGPVDLFANGQITRTSVRVLVDEALDDSHALD
jgi:methylated-DNA-[protein]-cysteine S-methyltransferase